MNALLQILGPVLKEIWDTVVAPEIQKLIDAGGNPNLKAIEKAFFTAINYTADAELPKI